MAPHQSDSTTRTRRGFLATAAAAGATALAGCSQSGDGSGDGDGLSGEITITGSSTVYPLATRMTNEFKDEHPDVTFAPSRTGSGGGFSNHFCKGNSMINNASRPITSGEEEQCADNGVEPVELEVARDALTIVVNNDADWLDCITFDELAHIWRPDDPAETWQDVNEEWPDEEITLWGAADTSGTYDYFTETIVGEAGASRDDANTTENDNQIISGVQEDEHALGYLGYAYYDENREAVTGLSVAAEADGECVEPSLENAKSGDYPLARPLFTYPAKRHLAKERVAEFCRFWLEHSTSDQIVAEDVGYVPNDEATQQTMQDRLETAIEDANAE
jgi:phosphate transport system substrate-binding protein